MTNLEIEKVSLRDTFELLNIINKEFSYFDIDINKLRDRIRDPNIFLYKIIDNDKIVAFIDFEIIDKGFSSFGFKLGRITGLAVVEEYRKKGLGKKLISFALEKFKAEGCKKVYLIVERKNNYAINLYSGFGFKEVKESDFKIADKDAFCMILDL